VIYLKYENKEGSLIVRTLYHYRKYGISPESFYRDCSITPNPFLPGRWSVNWDDFSRPWTWKKFITKQVAGLSYWVLGKDDLPEDVEDIREQVTYLGIPEFNNCNNARTMEGSNTLACLR